MGRGLLGSANFSATPQWLRLGGEGGCPARASTSSTVDPGRRSGTSNLHNRIFIASEHCLSYHEFIMALQFQGEFKTDHSSRGLSFQNMDY